MITGFLPNARVRNELQAIDRVERSAAVRKRSSKTNSFTVECHNPQMGRNAAKLRKMCDLRSLRSSLTKIKPIGCGTP